MAKPPEKMVLSRILGLEGLTGGTALSMTSKDMSSLASSIFASSYWGTNISNIFPLNSTSRFSRSKERANSGAEARERSLPPPLGFFSPFSSFKGLKEFVPNHDRPGP